jgi:hypothetical protein
MSSGVGRGVERSEGVGGGGVVVVLRGFFVVRGVVSWKMMSSVTGARVEGLRSEGGKPLSPPGRVSQSSSSPSHGLSPDDSTPSIGPWGVGVTGGLKKIR